MASELKTVVEKYCPIVGRNVAVEVSGRSGDSCCLNEHACRDERGGCKNSLFLSDRSET